MKNFNCLLISLVICAQSANAQLKIDEDYYIRLFNDGSYKQVYDDMIEIRTSKPYGKSSFVDFMISMSLCATQHYSDAREGFNYILDNYQLSSEQKEYINQAKSSCSQSTSISDSGLDFISRGLLASNVIPRAYSRGKTGLDCSDTQRQYITYDQDFNESELKKRLFKFNEKAAAVSHYTSFLKNEYNIDTSGRFIIITPKPVVSTKSSVRNVERMLERALSFYTSYYNLKPPDMLIAVYLAGDRETLRSTALKTHGIKLSPGTWGYSCIADLSVLGSSDEKHIGTILHELFHLVIRTDLGDIPAWLDEGGACLYETSYWKGDTLFGMKDQWRTEVLSQYLKNDEPLPTLKYIIDGNWNLFEGRFRKDCEVAIYYSLMKHFSLYLQEGEIFQNLITAYRDRKNVLVDTSFANEAHYELLKKVTGKEIEVINLMFLEWLEEVYNLKIKYDGESLKQRLMVTNRKLNSFSRYETIGSDSTEYQVLLNEGKLLTEKLNQGTYSSGFIRQVTTVSDVFYDRLLAYFTNVNKFLKKHS